MSTTTSAPDDLVHTADTPLETGWNATTPAGDNVVLDASRAMASAYAALATAGGHRVRDVVDMGLHLVDTGSPSPFGNTAHLTRPLLPALVGAARLHGALLKFYGGAAGGPFLVFSPFPTDDLSAIGLSPVGHPPLMARWTPTAPAPSSAIDVRRVANAAELADFEQVLVEGYPVRELWPYTPQRFLRPAVLPTAWEFFVGYVDGVAVAGSAAFVTGNVRLVEMVATRPAARGNGFGALLTDAAAGNDPTRTAVLIASDDGRGVYARLGFRAVSRFTLWAGTRG